VTASTPRSPQQWWGAYDLPENQQGCWRLGPLTLWIQHLSSEWRVAYLQGDENDATLSMDIGKPMDEVEDIPDTRSYCFSQAMGSIRLHPALPDRSVVAKPAKPLYVFPGEQVTLYMIFPIWVRIEVGESARLLQQIACYRLSDTWFGPNTREGDLCYASRTFGRLHLEEVPTRAHRVITAVTIRNRATDALLLERLNVPLPSLTLFCDSSDMLWTNALLLERLEGQGMANLEIQRRPVPQVGDVKLLTGPRQVEHRNLLVRAFSSFLT